MIQDPTAPEHRRAFLEKYRSLKIAVGFVILVVVAYVAYQAYGRLSVGNKHFAEIAPGKFALLGMSGGTGYHIIVANNVAQLVQGDSKFEASGFGEEDEGAAKHHVPIKYMVESLQGNTDALGQLITAMNDNLRKWQAEEIPPNPVIWTSADLEKALAGDAQLRQKLERDLNAKLDGTPADFITQRALYTGIVIKLPVTVKVNVGGVVKPLTANVQIPYRVGFTRKVERELAAKGVNPTEEEIKGYYLQERQDLLAHKNNLEDVANTIKQRISPTIVAQYAEPAEALLANTKVVLNENLVDNAMVEQVGMKDNKPMYNLTLNLTEEGRQRLWQYSLDKVGSQLLLIENNVAIAAPRVQHQLSQSNITVTQLADPTLAQEAADVINEGKKSR